MEKRGYVILGLTCLYFFIVFGIMQYLDYNKDYAKIYANKYHVDVNLIRAVIFVESRGNNAAISPKGAIGAMQVMPKTEIAIIKAFDIVIDDKSYLEVNIEVGTAYLSDLLITYDGDVKKALAFYNGGHYGIKALKSSKQNGVKLYVRDVLLLKEYLDHKDNTTKTIDV